MSAPTVNSEVKSAKAVPIAIIGMGCLFPQANSPEAFWANINNCVDCITDIPATHWRPEDYYNADPAKRDHTYAKRGGFLSPVAFNPLEFGISPRDIEAIDTTQLLGMVVAKQAMRDAGYDDKREFNRQRTSVILGVTGALELVVTLGARLGFPKWRRALQDAGVSDTVTNDVMERISNSYVDWQENSFPGLLGNVAAGRIANRLNLGGTNCVVDAACASSITALHLAGLELAAQRVDMVITGGFDTFNDIFMYMCFSKTPALSPTGNSKPFDAKADGTIIGEGLGALVLKRLDDAVRDNDKIYAVIRGIGTSSDGKGNAVYAPSQEGQSRALKDAYSQAGISPETVELVEAHGTGTKVGDSVEIQALTQVYRGVTTKKTWCALGSVKSQIGHTKAAAGVAGMIKATLALYHKVLPPTIKVTKPNEHIESAASPFYVNNSRRPWLPNTEHPRRAAVSAFGFGGSNFHCVLEEHQKEKPVIDWDGRVQILAFAADSREELQQQVSQFPKDLSWEKLRAQAGTTRRSFDCKKTYRLTLAVEREQTNLPELFSKVLARLAASDGAKSWQTPDGVYYSAEQNPGKLGILFSGQGSQYVGMLRDLVCHFPVMHQVLADANDIFSQFKDALTECRLSDFIYPHPEFSDEERKRNEDNLRDTRVAQPALGAIGLGLYKVLQHFGIKPEALAGHSYGELLALCAGESLKEKALHLLSNIRGQLMGQKTDEAGAMLAVQSSPDETAKLLKAEGIELTVANKNAPNQTVLSGAIAEIKKAMTLLNSKNIRSKMLNVSAAFHSHLVEHAQKPFEEALKKAKLNVASIPVYSNITALPYPKNVDEVRSLLSNQLARPVEFIQQIENMYASGVRTFLEVGPNQHLTGMVKSILRDRTFAALAMDAHLGKRAAMLSLGLVLAHLAALGYATNLEGWDDTFKLTDDGKATFTVALCGANSFTPKATKPPIANLVAPQGAGAETLKTLPSTIASSPSTTVAKSTDVQHGVSSRTVEPRSVKPTPLPIDTKSTGAAIKSMTNQQPTISMKSERSYTPDNNDNTSSLTGDASVLREALNLTQKNLLALQHMQTQTADLHRRFLQGQEASQRSFQSLIEQQRHLLSGIGAVGNEVASKPETLSRPKAERTPVAPSSTPARKNDQASASNHNIAKLSNTVYVVPPPPAAVQAPPPMQLPAAAINPVTSSPAVAASANVSSLQVEKVLLQLISEKTGYPIETLNLDMGLDTDLGIDSIKRVEILSALQVKLPDVPTIGPAHMGTLHTLRQIVNYLSVGSVEQKRTTGKVDAPAKAIATPTVGLQEKTVAAALLKVVSDKTGYPMETLNLKMGLDTDLGIDSIKRVEILSALQEQLPQAPSIGPDQLGTLHTLEEIVSYLCQSASGKPAASHVVEAPATSSNAKTENKADIALNDSQIATALLQVVSDKTGYPAEMLNLEMGLDTDLGIDSIKRVEILSALQEKLPGIPAFGSDQIGQFHSLRQIVEYIKVNTSSSTEAFANQNMMLTDSVPADSVSIVEEADIRLQRLTLELADLNSQIARPKVRLNAHSRILVTDNGARLSQAIVSELAALGYRPELFNVQEMESIAATDEVDGLIVISPATGARDGFLKNAFKLAQHFSPALKNASKKDGALFVTISRMDGMFGINGMNGQSDPFSGGLAGLLKTAHHEWPEIQCKAVDINVNDESDAEVAKTIVDEILLVGPLEVGVAAQHRVGLQLTHAPNAKRPLTAPINAGDVVVVTGGARGVTVEIAVAMAAAWKPTLVLLGRSPAPQPEPAWLQGLTGEAQIKRALVSQSGQKLTPKMIESEYRALLANREITANLKRIEALGTIKVVYYSVDVRDEQQVNGLINEIRKTYGPIAGLVHGAGVIADRRIEDKTEEMFNSVYETKVGGLQTLLAAVDPQELKMLAMFSSSTGRFGRSGQVDYAVANEVLNKIAQQHAQKLQNCRVISFNWGPWEGGMVNPALKTVFASEGVSLIPLAAGAEFFIREFGVNGYNPVEVVVLGPADHPLDEQVAVSTVPAVAEKNAVLDVVMKRSLSVSEYSILKSHVLDGKAVLPMAMMIEFMGLTARHAHPGLQFLGFDDLKVNARLSLANDETVTMLLKAGKLSRRDQHFVVPVQLCRQAEDNEVIHAQANVVLGNAYELASAVLDLPALKRYSIKGNVYQHGQLFHGEDLFGIEKIEGCATEGIAGWSRSAPAPGAWIERPLRSNWVADPLVLDSSFQMMILWSLEIDQVPCLPVAIGSYRQYRTHFPSDGVKIDIRVNQKVGALIYADMKFSDRQGQVVAMIKNYIGSQNQSLIESFRNNKLTLIS